MGAQGGMAVIAMDAGRLFGPGALRLALCFFYTGELPLASSGGRVDGHDRRKLEPLAPNSEGVGRLLELLLVADYTQHTHLKQTGERLIIEWEVLQVENVVNVYEHAMGASCSQLQATCEAFMRGMFEVVSATDDWARLDEAHKKKVTTLPVAVPSRT